MWDVIKRSSILRSGTQSANSSPARSAKGDKRASITPQQINFKDWNLTLGDDDEDGENEESQLDAAAEVLASGDSTGLKRSLNRIERTRQVIIMVGLPGRGKTFLCNKLKCYLNWLGHQTKHINVGSYRRQQRPEGETQGADFFDHNNPHGKDLRQQAVQAALADLDAYLASNEGQVVIFDATNTTEERRRKLVQHFHGRYQYLFIESICNDTHTLEQNYLFKMRFSPDYQGVNEAEGLADFKARVAKYEEVYEPLVDRNVHYIKLIDMVTGRGYMDVNRISGYIPGKIVFFLMQICKAGMAQSRKIWLTRHGESVFNQRDLIGGDSSLSERGEDYARTLPDAVIDRLPLTLEDNTAPVSVWTSTLKRTIQTASYLPFAKLRWKALDEIHAGSCDGLTYAEIEEWFPEEFKARGDDKLRYRYPAGESYMDVIQRLEPVVIEMERERECVCVVSHQAVLRAILGYFTNTPLEDIPNLEIPLHTIIELRPRPDGTMEVERLPVGMPSQSSREGGNDAASAPYTTHMPPPASPVQIPLGAIGEDEREHLSSLQSFARRRQSYGDAKNGGTGTSLPEATQALGASRMQAAPVLRKRSASIGNNRELAGMPTPQLAGHDTAAAGAAAAAAAPARSVVALV